MTVWALRFSCAAALAIYFAFAVLPACTRFDTNGYAAYYTASRILLERPGELSQVYDAPWFQSQVERQGFHAPDVHNVQPPTMSLMLAPLAWTSAPRARVVWVLLSVAFWIAGLGLLARALGLWEGRHTADATLLLAALTTLYTPIADCLRHGQCYTFLFFLLCLSLRLALGPRTGRAGRALAAGAPLGVMLVLKTAGAWLIVLLALARRWRILLGAVASVAVLLAFSSAWVGFAPWRVYLRELPTLESAPWRYVTAYQTLTSLTGHLLVFDARWNPSPAMQAPRLAAFLDLAAMLAVLAVSVRLQRLNSEADADRALTFAMFTAPIVCMAPFAEGYHYVLVLPALVVACSWAVDHRVGAGAWALLATSALLIVTPLHYVFSLAGEQGWRAAFAYPRVYGALLVWGWCALALARRPATETGAAWVRPATSEG
jgi:hypothetical protein